MLERTGALLAMGRRWVGDVALLYGPEKWWEGWGQNAERKKQATCTHRLKRVVWDWLGRENKAGKGVFVDRTRTSEQGELTCWREQVRWWQWDSIGWVARTAVGAREVVKETGLEHEKIKS